MRYRLAASLALILGLAGCGKQQASDRGEQEHSDRYYKDQMDRDTQAAIQGIGADQADKEQMQRTMVDMVRSSQGELAATQLDLCLIAAPRAVVRKLRDSLAMGKTVVIDETDKTPRTWAEKQRKMQSDTQATRKD
jgi:hypothetical protein